MKKTILLTLLSIIGLSTANAQVGIGTITPDATSILDVTATDKGFLPPRLTTAQRNAIASPAEGLVIFNTTVNCLQWYIGNAIWHNGCGNNAYLLYPPNTNFCNVAPTEVVDVLSPTGRRWMDRNLGARRAAQTRTDTESYGSLYQWGRASDGHQCINRTVGDGVVTSNVILTPSSTNQPPHGDYINVNGDWVSPSNTNRWNITPQENNPCPIGYRVPTTAEFEAERLVFKVNPGDNASPDEAFDSVLKIPSAGRRNSGTVGDVGSSAYFWMSEVSISGFSNGFRFITNSSNFIISTRHNGYSVRCIKD